MAWSVRYAPTRICLPKSVQTRSDRERGCEEKGRSYSQSVRFMQRCVRAVVLCGLSETAHACEEPGVRRAECSAQGQRPGRLLRGCEQARQVPVRSPGEDRQDQVDGGACSGEHEHTRSDWIRGASQILSSIDA
eukprot:2481709-Rhodomonas_salina.4